MQREEQGACINLSLFHFMLQQYKQIFQIKIKEENDENKTI